jgi:sugar lactone lactonase YvrE
LLPAFERGSGRTHGIAVTEDDRVVVFRQADPAVLLYDTTGVLLDTWGDRFLGAHGLTLVREDSRDLLWLTDQDSGEVVKTTLAGDTVLALAPPRIPAYEDGTYAPTWVAVFEERMGGDGTVWVADGYGMSLVHRYDRTGRYLGSLSGEEGEAGAFDCPHGVWFDTRCGDPELYVADRGNRRLQVFDPEGTFKRVAGVDALECPCVGAVHDGELYVPELCARIAVLDTDNRLIRYVGRNEAACDRPDWPDLPGEDLRPGAFNSPHGIAVDADGSLYVVEWIVGGRLTKLARA